MRNLKKNYMKNIIVIFNLLSFLFIYNSSYANNIELEIKGNEYIDREVIISLIDKIPTEISDEYSNYLLKELNSSNLFKDVKIQTSNNKYIINIIEFDGINKFYFKNNKRLKDEELLEIINELKLVNTNPLEIEIFINEVENIYKTFGYNNVKITYIVELNSTNKTSDIYFDINEGEITKIAKITFIGNNNINDQQISNIIRSRTKSLKNIFVNNNFKSHIVKNDIVLIKKFYKNNGYKDIEVNNIIEYLDDNKVNIIFNINEGDQYTIKNFNYFDENNIISNQVQNSLTLIFDNAIGKNNVYSPNIINELKDNISDILIKNEIKFFEIESLEKVETNKVDILYKIISIEPKYINQINIVGNNRTFDSVIRREISFAEGDPYNEAQISLLKNKLLSLNLFEKVTINTNSLNDNLVDLEINIEEKSTGSINAGLSIGTLEGFAVVAGINEKNFAGSGRSINAQVNTSDNNTLYTLSTSQRLNANNQLDLEYGFKYNEQNFSKTSSYKLNTFSVGSGIKYRLNKKTTHSINLDYKLKDYIITDRNSVSSDILNSEGDNVSFILNNSFFYNTLNSLLIPKNGNSIRYFNSIETPTSSNNGYIKNILTIKNFKKIDRNIFSIQSRFGNVTSLNNNKITTDDKFSLGGRWLRGFDIYGAGPRNSSTSYIGGDNLIVTKLDYNRELTNNSNTPFYLNIFNDYGLVWGNKNHVTQNDNSIRASYGFGIKYYSAIGPIGFTWGFPLMDESYDIKRMFLFSVGNIN